MKRLMEEADFPIEAIEEMENHRERMQRKGSWERLEMLAQQIMERPADNPFLVETLTKAEAMEADEGIHKYTLDLLLLLNCWQILKDRYKEQGISMEIFQDTLKDLKYKLLECKDVYGVYGIFVGSWYSGFFAMTRFALGRLQFEMKTYPYETPYTEKGCTVQKGDPVINMHIPSSGPLSKEEAESSFSQAEAFFWKGKEEPAVFVMNSWLLDTDLVAILPEGNCKKFVQQFSILEASKNEVFQDAWRVFGKDGDKLPDKLPRRTRLQRVIGDYLQQGGKLGSGYGIFIRA